MAQRTPASYQQTLANVEDGSLVLLIGVDDRTVPAIKGMCHDEVTATVLTDVVRRPGGEAINGPIIYFGDDAECLVLGKDFSVDYDPMTVEFRPDGKWDLGLLAVDANGRAYISAQSTKGGQTFVAVDSGGSPNRGPVAVFRNWAIFITHVDGARQELYRHGG